MLHEPGLMLHMLAQKLICTYVSTNYNITNASSLINKELLKIELKF